MVCSHVVIVTVVNVCVNVGIGRVVMDLANVGMIVGVDVDLANVGMIVGMDVDVIVHVVGAVVDM